MELSLIDTELVVVVEEDSVVVVVAAAVVVKVDSVAVLSVDGAVDGGVLVIVGICDDVDNTGVGVGCCWGCDVGC